MDLLYSNVASISKEDYEWLREMLSQFLESAIECVRVSDEQNVTGLNFDLFELWDMANAKGSNFANHRGWRLLFYGLSDLSATSATVNYRLTSICT